MAAPAALPAPAANAANKSRLTDLAIFGGQPAFSTELHVGRPNIGDRQRLFERWNEMLDRRWLSNTGPLAHEFEQRLREIVGTKHCVVMCNATIALEIMIRAAGLSGEVIVPSFTFIATAHALQWQEITPVFCDVDPVTHTLDPRCVEKMITPRTTGIIGVHLWGGACDVEGLEAVARRHGLKLLFDAAHAFACSHHGQMIGSFGQAEVFSFHATKFLNSLEGGALVTNDDELANKVRLMQNFGFRGATIPLDQVRPENRKDTYDRVVYLGTNGKMTEAAAAMGLTSLESLDEFIAVNRANYVRYHENLAGLAGVRMMTFDDQDRHNFQYIVVEVDDAVTAVDRDAVIDVLHAENVLARRYFYPGCHQMEPYRSYFPHASLLLPTTDRLARQVMTLPTGTAVTADDIDRICEVIRFVLANGREVTLRLG